ncbi:MAG TPA: DUF1883 domain-containing protein [Ferruginibacter sp.]|nr:DUF1883 domain-containing protein [Ferruginibacter sp.]
MSDFLYQRHYLKGGDVVVLNCDTQCNFILVDDNNFHHYKNDNSFYQAEGSGFFKYFPAQIVVPHTGYWIAVLDLGGGSANIKYSFSFIT